MKNMKNMKMFSLNEKIIDLLNLCEKIVSDEGEYLLHKFVIKTNDTYFNDSSIKSDYFVCFVLIEGKDGQGKTLVGNDDLNLDIMGNNYQENLNIITNTFAEFTNILPDGTVFLSSTFGQAKYFLRYKAQ